MGIVISSLITLAVILTVVFLIFKVLLLKKGHGSDGKAVSVNNNELETTQSLFGKESIVTDDGIIEIGGSYRACLSLSQVNMRTNTDVEKLKVWVSFRSFLNEVGMPYTFVQLSQFVDIREYAHMYRGQLEKGHLTRELEESGLNVARFIECMDENRNSRDYHGYVIFTYDPDSDSIDSGVATGNPKLDELIGKFTGKQRLSKGERKNLARMVLTEASNITKGYADQMGMQCSRLNKGQVYGLSHKILQKDYASFSSPDEASSAQCFTAFHDSITAKVLAQELEQTEG